MLRQYLQTLTQANLWVYGTPTADLANRGVERRAQGFTNAVNTAPLVFYSAWPTAITQGLYEIHLRFQRSMVLEWINDAVGQLGIYWYRLVRDDSLITEENTRVYNLPASQKLMKVTNVEILTYTGDEITGFPYMSATPWNWSAEPYTDQFGNHFFQLQFAGQPPPDRIIRVWGEGYYPELECDGDVLALGGPYEVPALNFIFDWVNYRSQEYAALGAHTTELDRYLQRMAQSLQRTKEWLASMLQPTHQPSQVVVPGLNDGALRPSSPSSAYQLFGAFSGPA